MLYERQNLKELHDIKHMHDTNDQFVKYDDKILTNLLPPYIYQNSLMNKFLNMLQPLVSLSIDQMNMIKNFKNYMVDKYDYRHNG
jgi:hypothetical protein